jgi:23S rRNA U2552 (ribose-2'-O)-methylase RlmE/FtsJ
MLNKNKSQENKNELNKNNYIPLISSLPSLKNNIFSYNPNILFSKNIDYPLFTLGFNYFIHQNKDKTEIFSEFKNKKRVYLVMNEFERYIDNYSDSIGAHSKIFFDIDKNKKPDILSRGFYKLWEILCMFDIIDINKNNFVSAHLAEGPGSFIQATMFYREKYSKKYKNDKYYAITLHSDDNDSYVPELEKNFINYYNKEKPQRFILHKTYSRKVAESYKDKDDGDITNPKTVNLFKKQLGKNKAMLVTADGGFEWNHENTQEQEAFKLIYGQMFAALSVQDKGGHFVCKFFETFTDTSVKFLYILSQFYNNIYLVKPLTSRPSNSEKYVVCMNFKYKENDKDYTLNMKKLTDILEKLHNNNLNIISIFKDFQVPQQFIDIIRKYNTDIANKQVKKINELIKFIKDQNYYGDVYQYRRQIQIDAAKYWNKRFMIPEKEYNKKINDVRASVINILKKK